MRKKVKKESGSQGRKIEERERGKLENEREKKKIDYLDDER